LFIQERKELIMRLQHFEKVVGEREQKITDVSAKYKEVSVNLHMEQETCQRMRSERDSFEREVRSLREEVKGLLSNQNSSSDAMAQRVTQLELEKKTIEKRL
jgi:septal ring factor EnvC (AmiA/AmiB activator)